MHRETDWTSWGVGIVFLALIALASLWYVGAFDGGVGANVPSASTPSVSAPSVTAPVE